MTERDSRFPYWLIVLGFPLFGGLFLGAAFGWSWAIGGGRPPEPLAVPVEVFLESVAEPLWKALAPHSVRGVDEVILFIPVWLAAWLGAGVLAAVLAWLLSLLVPGGRGEER